MLASFWFALQQHATTLLQKARRHLKTWTKPMTETVAVGTVTDLTCHKTDLILENALLRQQLIVLQRQVKRPNLTWKDRLLMMLLSSHLRTWKQALLIVQPETLQRWHRDLFKRFWRRKSRCQGGHPPLAPEIITLIQQMARDNRLWGAERIRGALRKSGWRVGKGTVLNYLRQGRPVRSPSQLWKTFLHNHTHDIWVCDFIQVTDVLFQSLFIFVILELGSRRVAHLGVTRHPTDAWVAQQLREATPFQQGPKYLVRDNDAKYGQHFAAVAAGTPIEVLKTPVRAPKANAICERFVGSVRRECLDHLLFLGERHLFRVMKAYIEYYNTYRPHQGLGQRIPTQQAIATDPPPQGVIVVHPILGGLHHHYAREAA